MNAVTRSSTAVAILLALIPSGITAQTNTVAALTVPAAVSVCESRNAERGALHALSQARELGGDAAKSALSRMQDSLALEAAARPHDVQVQYLLAASMGLRADVEGGRERIRAAQELYSQAHRVLVLEPDHAGAQYLLGRLHAAVMRLDKVTRFLAKRLVGGAALSEASWEEAQRLMEAAASGDPCTPEYHYELARLYAERGDHQRAALQLETLFRYEREATSAVGRKAQVLYAELTRGRR